MFETFGWVFIHFLWQGAVTAVLLWLVLAVLQRRSAQVRYGVACAALVLMVALPIGTGALLHRAATFEATLPPAAKPTALLEAPGRSPNRNAPAVPVMTDPLPRMLYFEEGQELLAIPSRILPDFRVFVPWIATFWLLGTLLFSVKLLGGWIVTQCLRTKYVALAPRELQILLLRLSRELGVTRAVRLMRSSLAQVPMVIGWLRPVILVPASAVSGLTSVQLEAILAHELAHIRRHDYLVNLLQNLTEALLFYHPAVWWVSNLIRTEREHCCDDIAVAVCGGGKLGYAEALAKLEASINQEPDLALAATGASLVGRIRRLAGLSTSGVESPVRWLAGIIGVVIISTAALVSSPPLALAITPEPAPLESYGLDRQIWITAIGAVRFSEDGRTIQSIGDGASVILEERHERDARKVRITQDKSGEFQHDYFIQNEPQPSDAEVRAWLQSILEHPEVRRILSQSKEPVVGVETNVDNSIPQVSLIRAGKDVLDQLHERRLVIPRWASDEEPRIRRLVGSALESAQLASHDVYTDEQLRLVLTTLVDDAYLHDEVLRAVVYAASEFHSDESKARFLIRLALQLSDPTTVRAGYVATAQMIRSEELKQQALEALEIAQLEVAKKAIVRQLEVLEAGLQGVIAEKNVAQRAFLSELIAQRKEDKATVELLIAQRKRVLEGPE
jgi:beta-lactamase regulating signal transducer with metallopeptidase domain